MADLALLLISTLVIGQAPGPQDAPSPDGEPAVLDDVVVQGRRGVALVEPEVELDGFEIDALGADDIGQVIRRLSEDFGLGDGPLIIVNGRPMADPGVFSGFPPDALIRAEVLPPQAGALYGETDPSRRVVNIVLQRRFHSRDARASLRLPTAGGRSETSLDLRQSSIIDTRTRQLGLKLDLDTALRAGERDQTRADGSAAETVTLRPASKSLSANWAQTASLRDWALSLRADGRIQERRSTALREDEPTGSRQTSRSLNMVGGLNGKLAGWSVQGALNGAVSQNERSGLSPSDSRTRIVSANLSLSRPLFDIPAGPAAVSLAGRASRSRSETEGAAFRTTHSGRAEGFSGSLSVLLLRRPIGEDAPAFHPGDLSVTVGANVSKTDSGRGEGTNLGFAWNPRPSLRISGNWSTSAQSLDDAQRFEPEYYGDPVVVFDFLTGEAVEVLPILGGNPDLRAPSTDQLSLSLAAGPFSGFPLQGGISYNRSDAVDGVGGLPALTLQVEAAFPERFHRGSDGRLDSIDQRPINYASALAETLNTSFGVSASLGQGGRRRDATLRLRLNHTWNLSNATTIHDGLPSMDRLAGDGGGVSRHRLGLAVDVSRGAWGLNAVANWREGYRTRRMIGQDGPDDLRVDAFSTVDLKFSYQFAGPPPEDGGRPRRGTGLQVQLDISNLLDARPSARLGDDRSAPGYGRDDQDPMGRTILISLKRRF
ncbi:MAG: TonB-dependent receptor [Brevundimonas sp.]|uniref:TonB-dependent receptor n=1 Tax=Brevundimonas sp. TaxID=1871086 RepID=UPI001A1CA4F5|nr:TonB-dependent receptor [Brevundimonas sp.]MBJ7319512.1 TonB-dependent receptor [Brevundimonas sp.]